MDFVKFIIKLGLTIALISNHANAWYNATNLEDCDPVQKWDVTAKIEQVFYLSILSIKSNLSHSDKFGI